MRSFYWLSLPFRNLSQCFCFFTIFRALTKQTVFISQTNRLADLSKQNILLRLTELDFWCTSAIVFLLSNFQPSSGTDHYHLTRLPDQTISFSLLADLRTRRLSMWSDRQTRQSYCYQTTRLDNVPITCIRPPEQTTLLLSDHQTRPFSCQHSITPEHFPLSGNAPAKTISSGRPPGQTTFRLSLTIQQQICTEHPYPPDLHPGRDISSWVGSYGGLIYIYRILNEPCKVYVYFPHTFSGKTLDFLLRLVFCFVLF